MSNFSPYANYGYLALIKETTAWTPVTPTSFLRLVSESIETNFGVSNVMEIAWSRERNIRSVPNQIEVWWDIEFYVEPKMIWHFLRGLYWAPTTQTLTAATAFRHVFEVTDTPKTYTIDIKAADAPWVHRYYGVQITGLSFEWDDNKLKCTASLSPRKAFINARVTAAASSGTSLLIDQTSWLTTADSILVLDKADWFTTIATLTISAIVSDTELTTSTIWVQLDEWDIIVIKKATATYDQDKIFTWLWGWQVYTWADIDNTSAVNKEAFTLEYKNEVEARYFGWLEESARYPGDVITKWYTWNWKIDKFYDSESNLDKLRKNEKFWLRVLLQWESIIEANDAVKASSIWGASNWFKVEAATAGKAWNDINVTLVINTTDDLEATQTGNNILVKLANSTASKNTGTLIAAAIDALSLVVWTADWTGATTFTTAVDNQNLWFYAWSTNVVGRDASEKAYLQFDNSAAKIDTYFPGWSEDDILMEEIPLTFYKDVETPIIPKKWSTRVILVNSVSSY